MTCPLPRDEADRPTPRPGILDITPYRPGKSKAEGFEHPVKLSSNENILGCSPAAKAAVAASVDRLHLYPDGRSNALREAVARHYGLEPDRLVFSDGTDEVLHLINQVYLEPGDNIIQGQYGFGAYAIGARACGAEVRFAPEPNLRIDVDAVLGLVDGRTRLVFITNPANPTGTWISADEVARLHAGLPPRVMLVLDTAYAEFCTDPAFDDGLELARRSANVIVTRTFSKVYGLAALRIGWAYAPADAADAIDRIRPPFNTSIPAQEAAIAALADEDFKTRSVALVEQWRPWLTQQLGGLGLEVTPSAANYVLVRLPATPGRTAAETAVGAEAFLAAHGYLVRGVAAYGLPEHLRITIGLEEHNRALVELLAAFLGRGGRG
ncbi:MAG: histidinol-phosphate transaminase [Caulobacteraceae bacterium]|nr:histidinol-phosphate transaminase [Caulobacteraceae bacterium]